MMTEVKFLILPTHNVTVLSGKIKAGIDAGRETANLVNFLYEEAKSQRIKQHWSY